MSTNFNQALDSLKSNESPSYATLAMLSGPSRSEVAAFAALCATFDVEARRTIITRLHEMAEESFELDFQDLFRQCLNDADATVREQAVRGLWEDDRPDLIAPLLHIVVNDPDVQVRAAAATAMGGFLFMSACDELEADEGDAIRATLERIALDHSQPVELLRRAIESLAHISDDRIRGLIDWAYEQDDELLRVSAVFAMGRSADTAWSETVLEALASPSAAIRYEAARAAGEIQIERAVEPLSALTRSSDRDIQSVAIWSLGQIGGARARTTLERLTQSKDEEVAIAADEALAELDLYAATLNLLVAECADGDALEEEPWEDDEGDTDEDDDDAEDEELDDDLDEWEDEPLDPASP